MYVMYLNVGDSIWFMLKVRYKIVPRSPLEINRFSTYCTRRVLFFQQKNLFSIHASSDIISDWVDRWLGNRNWVTPRALPSFGRALSWNLRLIWRKDWIAEMHCITLLIIVLSACCCYRSSNIIKRGRTIVVKKLLLTDW